MQIVHDDKKKSANQKKKSLGQTKKALQQYYGDEGARLWQTLLITTQTWVVLRISSTSTYLSLKYST